jgi:hypothetical protein
MVGKETHACHVVVFSEGMRREILAKCENDKFLYYGIDRDFRKLQSTFRHALANLSMFCVKACTCNNKL